MGDRKLEFHKTTVLGHKKSVTGQPATDLTDLEMNRLCLLCELVTRDSVADELLSFGQRLIDLSRSRGG